MGHWVMIHLLVFVVKLCFYSNSQQLTCHPRDLEALRGFINDLEPKPDDGWALDSSYADCCEWEGVTCKSSSSLRLNDLNNTGRVTKLELVKKRLSSKLSDSLWWLDQIRVLNLSGNFIVESIPFSVFNLVNLKTLDLSSNALISQVPKSLNLHSLINIDLSSNELNGSLPTQVCHNSTELRLIRLEKNNFSRDFPSGLEKCAMLEHLFLGENHFPGSIHAGVFHLQRLNLLRIQENNLSGSLSPALGNLSNLVDLNVSSNRFSGEIPDVFNKFPKLQFLVAHGNRFTGGILGSLSNLQTLNLLDLRNNSLSGPLRLTCTSMTKLTSLSLGSNNFNGSWPDNLPSCRHLRNVNLARNAFHGAIARELQEFPKPLLPLTFKLQPCEHFIDTSHPSALQQPNNFVSHYEFPWRDVA